MTNYTAVKELIEKRVIPFVKHVAEKYVKPFAASIYGKLLLPAWRGFLERLFKPVAKSAFGKFVAHNVKRVFDKYVRPVTLDIFNKYVKPERRKLFTYASIAWVVLASAVFINWPRLVYDAFQEIFATNFSGTQWRIESENGKKGVFVKLAQRGAVEYNSLEADNYVPLSGAKWMREGRNGLEIKIGTERFGGVAPDQGERKVLDVSNVSQDPYYWRSKSDATTVGNWYLASTKGDRANTARQSVDPDRAQLQAFVGSHDQPAIHFMQRMDVSIPGHVFSERCTEMVRMLHRKEIYLLWSVVRVKGAGDDVQPYLMMRETHDGEPSRISVGEENGTVPIEVKRAVSLLPSDPGLWKTLILLNRSCGSDSSPITGNGHLKIPALALVVPEGQKELKFDELKKVLQGLVAKLAQGRNQVVGDVLVLNVPPQGDGKSDESDVRYDDLEGFVRMSAKEVQVKPVKIAPVRRRVIRKLAR